MYVISLLGLLTRCTLAGVAQWIECGPVNQKVASLIPSQGTCLGFRLGLQLGGVLEVTC